MTTTLKSMSTVSDAVPDVVVAEVEEDMVPEKSTGLRPLEIVFFVCAFIALAGTFFMNWKVRALTKRNAEIERTLKSLRCSDSSLDNPLDEEEQQPS